MPARKPTATKRRLASLKALSIYSTKMYFRNVTALFFTLFFPVLLIIVFGYLFQNNNFKTKLAITNHSHEKLATDFEDQLKKVDAFQIQDVNEDEARDLLSKGKVDLQVVIPAEFGQINTQTHALTPVKIKTFYNEGRPQQGQTTNLILGQIVAGYNDGVTRTPTIIGLDSQGVKTNNLGVIDFFLPGVIAMSIMQLGIFSVAFGFIAFKTTGALRRLQATPMHPMNFILGQSVARIIVTFVQIFLLLGLGIWMFHAKLVGNIFEFLALGTLGAAVFLTFGFAIAGWAKDENQAAPVAQLIQLPMLFLSGVFFSRDSMPHILQKITDYLPLTYLVDGLRRIANEGAHLWNLGGDLLGLVVWGLIMLIVTVKVFRWE